MKILIVFGVLLVASTLGANTWAPVPGGTTSQDVVGAYPPNASPRPSTRSGGASWKLNNDFYFFGGTLGPNTVGPDYSDMWKVNMATPSGFMYLGGPKIPDQYGIYSGANAWPGSRRFPVTWTYGGFLYMYGGWGESENSGGILSDLWKCDPSTTVPTWTYLGNAANKNPGQIPIPNGATNARWPGGRFMSSAWHDAISGKLYLFGGQTRLLNPSTNTYSYVYMNDMWYYQITSGAGPYWTRVAGWDTGNANPRTVAVPGQYDATPGSRRSAHTWLDNQGKYWLFGGGSANCLNGQNGWATYFTNDLWYYDTTTNKWLFASSPGNTINCASHGLQTGAGQYPSATIGGLALMDKINNKLVLFGGYGYDTLGNYGLLNAVWVYSINFNSWVRMQGTTVNMCNSGSAPGGRNAAYGAVDPSSSVSKFWLYGGNGCAGSGGSSTTPSSLGDLWTYTLSP